MQHRFAAQLLTGEKPRTVGAALEHCVALQGQELKAFRLNARARTTGVVSSDLDAALESGELVVSWLNRGTLHLVRAEDHDLLHALTTPQLASASRRRLAQEGVSPAQAEAGVRLVQQTLDDGPASRTALREVLAAAGVPVAGQALVHILLAASLTGSLVRGPVRGTEQIFVRHEARPVDRTQALGWLGPRYLAAHPDGTPADLARWAGLTLGDARRALADVRVPEPRPALSVPPLLLGPWDEVLLGWVDRSWVLGDRTDLITVNGIFRPMVVVGGVCVGSWGLPGGRVQLQLDDGVDPALLDAEVAAVEAFVAG